MLTEKKNNAAANSTLPPFYGAVTPLISKMHAKLRLKGRKDYSFATDATGIVLAVEEFPSAERDYPIIFSAGDRVMPVAMTGIPGGRNQFVSADGLWKSGAYIPVYVRRYPFILAKVKPEASDLTLCFDPESDALVEGRDGNLFDGDEPSARTKAILQLCEWYEGALVKSEKFVDELKELDLLMDAEASIRLIGKEPAIFRGFKVVSEENFKKLPDAEMRMLAKSGALALIHAHFFSLKNIERLFSRHPAGRFDDKENSGRATAA